MTAKPGRDALIKISEGGSPETFTTVGGMRIKRSRFAQSVVDNTDHDSPGNWRELLASAGKKLVRLEGDGVFKDSASEDSVRAAFFATNLVNFQFILPDWGTIEGPFLVQRFDTESNVIDEVKTRMVFESGGLITWTGV